MDYLKRRPVPLILLTILLDTIFFGLTDPAEVAPLWLIVGFVLAVATIYWFIRLALTVLGVYLKGLKTQQQQLTTILTSVSAVILGMQSMGQFSLRDFLVLVPLVLVGYFYIRYNRRSIERN